MMSSNLRALCAVLLPLAVACGGGGSSSSISQADLPLALAKAQCTKILAGNCCPTTANPPTEANCETKLAAEITTELNTGLAMTNQQYNGDQAAACINSYANLACGALLIASEIGACQFIIYGKVANGGACTNYTDCQSGFCVTPNGTNTGACTAQQPSGGACLVLSNQGFEGNECGGGSQPTDPLSTTGNCTCKPPQPDGSACTSLSDCTSFNCDATTNKCAPYGSTLDATYCGQLYAALR